MKKNILVITIMAVVIAGIAFTATACAKGEKGHRGSLMTREVVKVEREVPSSLLSNSLK